MKPVTHNNGTQLINRVAETAFRSVTHKPLEVQFADLCRNISKIQLNLMKAARGGRKSKVTDLSVLLSNQKAKANLIADAIVKAQATRSTKPITGDLDVTRQPSGVKGMWDKDVAKATRKAGTKGLASRR